MDRQSIKRRGLSGVAYLLSLQVLASIIFPLALKISSFSISALISFSSFLGVLTIGSSFMIQFFLCFLQGEILAPFYSLFISLLRMRQYIALYLSSLQFLTLSIILLLSTLHSFQAKRAIDSQGTGTSFLQSTKSLPQHWIWHRNSLESSYQRVTLLPTSTKIELNNFVTLELKNGLELHLQLMILERCYYWVSPLNGSSAASIAQSVTPNDHTSIRQGLQEYLRRSQGGEQEGVPQIVLLNYPFVLKVLQLKPKSTNLTFQNLSKRIFSGLMSRWLTPIFFKQSRADRTCLQILAASRSPIGPSLTMRLQSSPFGQYSMKMQILLSFLMTQQIWAMFQCKSLCCSRISPSTDCTCYVRYQSIFIILTATVSPVGLWIALLTLANPPSPMFSSM